MTRATSRRQTSLREADYRDQADFRYALRRFFRFSELHARGSGITPQQHMLLLMVRGHPAYPQVTIGDIAERMQIRHHSASLLVERSLKRGLIERKHDTVDRRRALVSLTSEGQRILDKITRANRRVLGSLEDTLFKSSFIEALRNDEQSPDEPI